MVIPSNALDRFAAKVEFSPDPDGCHQWTGACSFDGYGFFWYSRKLWLAQRFAYTAAHGPIATGLTVRSTCRNPGCVRPDHLTLGTRDDIRSDMVAAMRNKMPDTPLAPSECEFIRAWVDLFGNSLDSAKHALGGMDIGAVRRGLRLGREAAFPVSRRR